MKRMVLLTYLLVLVLFLTCKKDDNGPASPTAPSTTGTPDPTPIGAPVGSAATTRIGAAGGTATSSDGRLSLSIPAGALASDTTISVQAISNNAWGGLGTAYRLGPSGIHFSSPVTLQFSYSNDTVQVPELLGVAYQDTDNIWYSVPDYTVDSTAQAVTASVNHFSDWTDFERVRIVPQQATLWVNQTLELTLIEQVDAGSGNQPQPIYRVTDNDVTWAASAGTISRTAGPSSRFLYATYRAPASVPAGNPVRVSATVNRRYTYHGTIVPTNRTVFFSYITITDSTASFHVDIYYNNPEYYVSFQQFTLSDTCGVDVTINRRTVSVSNFTNHQPGVIPPSRTSGDCTLSWLSGEPGPMNIRSGTGSIDTAQNVVLSFYHTAISEQWQLACSGQPPVTFGGDPLPGEPDGMTFPTNSGSSHFYWQVNPNVYAWITRR